MSDAALASIGLGGLEFAETKKPPTPLRLMDARWYPIAQTLCSLPLQCRDQKEVPQIPRPPRGPLGCVCTQR